MKRFPPIAKLTPRGFELQVKAWLESVSGGLEEFSAQHLDHVLGTDGEYTFDATARFRALGGATFLVVVECKKHQNPIKREAVQALRDKQLSVGAQKAMVVATSTFQSGAIEYASVHNIALVQVIGGHAAYVQASLSRRQTPPPDDAEDFAGFFYGPNPDGRLVYPEILTTRANSGLASYLGVDA